jgi:hypothetical protein
MRQSKEVTNAKTRERLRRLRANNPGYSTAKNRDYQKKNPQKRAAHKALEKALRLGEIIRAPCIVCGNPRAEGHHEDYARQLDVTWLCRTHHLARHKETGRD